MIWLKPPPFGVARSTGRQPAWSAPVQAVPKAQTACVEVSTSVVSAVERAMTGRPFTIMDGVFGPVWNIASQCRPPSAVA